MKGINSEPIILDIDQIDGKENQSYLRSQSDQYLPMFKDTDRFNVKNLSRTASAGANTFPVIYELPIDDIKISTADIPYPSPTIPYPSSAPPTIRHQKLNRRSTILESFERQLSLPDSISDRASTILVWQNLTVSTREDRRKEFFQRLKSSKNFVPQRKVLLHNISGAITGGLWAVMGASGSGKSTLLNTLACRLDVNTIVEGEMRLNGAPYDNAELKRIAGYVMQDNLLNGYLTVEETLMYTAKLRLPRIFTDKQRKERVEDVMTDLNLVPVRKATIGTTMKQGISGSERKRLCVSMELLNRPQLLFLDEPTTGLDSVTALDLLHTLHKLAHGKSQEKAVTIVCSIHQPQSKIFDLFDSLVLLKAGNIIYQGPRNQAMEVYHAAGFPCPLYTNPADHLLDVITPLKIGTIHVTLEQEAATEEAIIRCQPPVDIDLNMGVDKRRTQMANLPLNPTWLTQTRILLCRNLREQSRKLRILMISLIQTIIMAVLIGIAFLNIGNTQTSIVRREPVIFFCIINQGFFGALTVINSFPVERTLTLRERASGTYFVSAYFTAKILADTLVQLPIPIVFSCIVYFPVGLQFTAAKFFIFTLFMLLCSIAATSLALMISAICKTTNMSVTVLPMAFEVSRLFGGFLLAPSRVPVYFSWLDALSYIKYSFVGASLNELHGLQLNCNGLKTTMFNATYNITETCITSGEELIKERGYDHISLEGCIGVLIAFIIFCRAWAFIGVRFLKN
ncbi:unnamed protein product [Adineta steineri]|uniref:ABC transporter domain-containing protein n=1 Tax=Adineta steineri TaxID=433720 RepID=A0A814B480_9BILA|nr:unnamed protein product [Adineta steineri]CAF3960617.1 unnamed protein product [Adineta steineri]